MDAEKIQKMNEKIAQFEKERDMNLTRFPPDWFQYLPIYERNEWIRLEILDLELRIELEKQS